MAPSLVETATEATPLATYKLNLGQYKETDGVSIDRDVETGKKGGNGAKVTVSWQLLATRSRELTRRLSTLTICPLGIPRRDTPLSSPLNTTSTAKTPTRPSRTSCRPAPR